MIEEMEAENPDDSWSPGKDYIFDNMPQLRKPTYNSDNEIVERTEPVRDASPDSDTVEGSNGDETYNAGSSKVTSRSY
ncbi:hypothetical protein K435DRAFT_874108 [Dendrothele bispora CBS 962.96]|uniref:Uncharacterized protein n=1 Tax=Dendrothele bispora (strain CBS 962.96) TaxID=1314807 RepID=A0A4S8KXI6_DENBC|nr:hypothetical protein K435DRAFT_874108 [Dendrothele bispora CBS 962.96]